MTKVGNVVRLSGADYLKIGGMVLTVSLAIGGCQYRSNLAVERMTAMQEAQVVRLASIERRLERLEAE